MRKLEAPVFRVKNQQQKNWSKVLEARADFGTHSAFGAVDAPILAALASQPRLAPLGSIARLAPLAF